MLKNHLYSLIIIATLSCAQLKALSFETAGTIIGLASVGYLSGKAYGEWVYSSATDRYATARSLIEPVSALPKHELAQHNLSAYAQLIKQEALHEHYAYCNSVWLSEIPFRHYPLLRYKKNLDTTISRLSIAEYINIGSSRGNDVRALLHDLRLIRYIIVGDYDFIKECRYYDIVHALEHNKLVNFFEKTNQ